VSILGLIDLQLNAVRAARETTMRFAINGGQRAAGRRMERGGRRGRGHPSTGAAFLRGQGFQFSEAFSL